MGIKVLDPATKVSLFRKETHNFLLHTIARRITIPPADSTRVESPFSPFTFSSCRAGVIATCRSAPSRPTLGAANRRVSWRLPVQRPTLAGHLLRPRSRKMKQVLLESALEAVLVVAERQSGHEDSLRATSRVSLVSLRRRFVTDHPLNTPAVRMLFHRDPFLGPIPQRTI